MDNGRDFLRAQINNSLAQHGSLIESIRDHSEQADNPKYRQLCLQYLPGCERHQGMLEQYAMTVGAEKGGGFLKGAIGTVLGKARDAVDAMRESDFLRVVGDIVMIRQAQDTFRTFKVAGGQINEPQLVELSKTAESHHDDMQRDFNELASELFVQHSTATSDADFNSTQGVRSRDI